MQHQEEQAWVEEVAARRVLEFITGKMKIVKVVDERGIRDRYRNLL